MCIRDSIVTVQFREPVKILIHNRDELIQYLRKWKYVNSTRTTIDCLYPLNAICAKEALFTPDEIETDANAVSYTHLDVYKRQE